MDDRQVDEGSPDNELLQPGRNRAATRAYRQTTATARPPDHALFNQYTPALRTCDASQVSEPSKYDETMRSPFRANWSYAMEGEFGGLEEAGTSEDA